MSLAILHEPRREAAVANTPPPVSAPEDSLFEIVYGQRVEKHVSFYACWIASRLLLRLGSHTEATHAGTVVTETMFILDREADLQRRPDLAFLSVQRLPLGSWPRQGELELAPDLAVEVASPHDLFRSVMAKIREYFQYGVRRVWVILPEERCVCVFQSPSEMKKLSAGDELSDETLFPGWRMPVAELFEPSAAAAAAVAPR